MEYGWSSDTCIFSRHTQFEIPGLPLLALPASYPLLAASGPSARTSSLILQDPASWWQAPPKNPSLWPQERYHHEAPSSELGLQAACQSLEVPSHTPPAAPAWDLGVKVAGSGQGGGLGMPGPGCLRPLGVRNARPGGAGKGAGPLPVPYTSAQTSL